MFNFLQRDPQIIKLLDQVYYVPQQSMIDSNLYVVGDPSEALMLIDTSNGLNVGRILLQMDKIGLATNKIQKVFLTHCHLDHLRGLYRFSSLLNSPLQVMIHEAEASILEEGTPEVVVPLGGFLGPIIGDLTKFFVGIKPFKVDRKLKNGDLINIGKLQFKVIHTPGHSAGSCSLFEENLKVLFSGDTVFRDGYFGRFDLKTGNLSDLLHSLKTLSELEVRVLCPGHNSPVIENGSWHIKLAYDIVQKM